MQMPLMALFICIFSCACYLDQLPVPNAIDILSETHEKFIGYAEPPL